MFESPSGDAELRDTRVAGTLSRDDGDFGRGVYVGAGASLRASGLLVEDNLQTGIYITGVGTSLDLRDSVVRAIQPSPGQDSARGVDATRDSVVQIRDSWFEGTVGAGIRVAERAVVDIERVTVTSAPPAGAVDMTGLQVQSAASVTASDVVLRGNVGHGFAVFGAGSRLEITDSLVSDTVAKEDMFLGFGGEVFDGGTLVASGLVIEGSSNDGLLINEPGSSADLVEVTVRGTRPAGPWPGTGVEVLQGASLVASGLAVQDTMGLGMVFRGEGTAIELTDSSVTGTFPAADGGSGRGIDIIDKATLLGTRLVLDGNTDVGLLIDGYRVEPEEQIVYTAVELYESQVSNTRAGPANLSAGIVAQYRARLLADDLLVTANEGPGFFLAGTTPVLRVTNATISDNQFAGVANLGGRIDLWDSTVTGTRRHPAEGGGLGVFAHSLTWWPAVDLRNVTFSDLPGPALYARGEGIYDLVNCDISDAGTWPSLPGGVLAREGAGGDVFYHLRVYGNAFHDLNGDAIVLDESSADIDEDYDTGQPNTFDGIPGAPLFVQCGEATVPTTVDDGTGVDPTCRSTTRPLGAPLQYFIRPVESVVVE